MVNNLPIMVNDLIVDKLNHSDALELFNLMSLPEIQEFLPDKFDSLADLQETLEWLIGNYNKDNENIIRLSLAIRKKDTNDFMGWVTYGPLPHDEKLKELGVAVSPQFWNQGIATNVCAHFLGWIRDNITKAFIYAEVDAKNVKSIRLMEKLKFELINKAKLRRDKIEERGLISKWGEY